MAKCSFIGLGVMGYPMAGHLVVAGHEVNVWNRTHSKAQKWATEYTEYKGQAFEGIQKCVRGAEFIFICVGEDKDVYDVIEQILPHAEKGAVIVDHTTASSKCATTCYDKAKAAGLSFIDAPISGGESGAINGQLSVMCGGEQTPFDEARLIMDAYSKAITLIGESGSGQMAKMINQICIAGILQGLSEGVHFASRMGLDMEVILQAIGKGAAQSWQMDNRAMTMFNDEFDFGFAVDWMRKDLGIVLSTAEENAIDLPLTKDVQEKYSSVQAMGGGRWDTSSLIKTLK